VPHHIHAAIMQNTYHFWQSFIRREPFTGRADGANDLDRMPLHTVACSGFIIYKEHVEKEKDQSTRENSVESLHQK
jgi:hypothetical protein